MRDTFVAFTDHPGLGLLLNTTLRSLILFAFAGVGFVLIRRTSAASRHLLLSAIVFGLLCLPGLSLVIPEWQLRCLPPAERRVGSLPAAGVSLPEASATLSAPLSASVAPLFADRAGRERHIAAHASAESNVRESIYTLQRVAGWLFAVWLTGATLCLGRQMWGLLRMRQIARRCPRVTEGALLTIVGELARQNGVHRPLHLRQATAESAFSLVPMTWGCVRPTLLLPESRVLASWPQARLHAVLLHEMGHIARQDWLIHTLAHIACALYWFHPLVWLLTRQMQREAEQACDDRVLRAGVKTTDYAEHLLEVVRAMKAARVGALPRGVQAMALPRAALQTRLSAILDPHRDRSPITARALLLVLLEVSLVLFPTASFRLAARASTWPTSPGAKGESERRYAGRAQPGHAALKDRERQAGTPVLRAASESQLRGLNPDGEDLQGVEAAEFSVTFVPRGASPLSRQASAKRREPEGVARSKSGTVQAHVEASRLQPVRSQQSVVLPATQKPVPATKPALARKEDSVSPQEDETSTPLGKATTGHVLGPDGKPVVGAEVSLEPLANGIIFQSVIRKTDALGAFRYPPFFNGPVRLRARQGNLTTTTSTVAQGGGEVTLRVVANGQLTLSGQVTDREGQRIAGAQVSLIERDRDKIGKRLRTTTTDAAGHYSFSGVWRDAYYTITAKTEGEEFGIASSLPLVLASDGQQAVATLVLPHADASIAGRVVDAEGKPVPFAEVKVSGPATPWRTATADSQGRFRIERIVQERVTLGVRSGDGWNEGPAQAGRSDVVLVRAKKLAPLWQSM